jgi:soluble lytic murein transglycosylase-like protein
MKRLLSLAWLAAIALLAFSEAARAQHTEYDALVAKHAKANAVPEALVHRVIVRESGYRAALLGRGGTIGLMQIKLATARALGYRARNGILSDEVALADGVAEIAGRVQWRALQVDDDLVRGR